MIEIIGKLLGLALQAAGRIEKAAARSAAYAGLAEKLLERGQKQKCLEVLTAALTSADSIKQPAEKAGQLSWIAGIYIKAGDAARGQEIFKRSLLLAGAAETAAAVGALSDIAGELIEAGLLEEAGTVLKNISEKVKTEESGIDITREKINAAGLYLEAGKTPEALEMLEEARVEALQNRDIWFRTEQLISIAEMYSSAGGNDRAEKIAGEALAEAERMEKSGLVYFWLKIAGIYILTGRKITAVEMLYEVPGKISPEEPGYSRAGYLLEAAERLMDLGEVQKAADFVTRARVVLEDVEDTKDRISGIIRAAGLLGSAGKTEDALEVASLAQSLIQKLKDEKSRLYWLGETALLLMDLQQREAAAGITAEIIRIVNTTGARTVGLGEIVAGLAEKGELVPAVRLVGIIREPHIKAEALSVIIGRLPENGREPGNELRQAVEWLPAGN